MLLVGEPILGEGEKKALADVVSSGWITMGQKVRDLETAFAQCHGAEDAVAVSSCTAAMHLIMMALDIGPGDEVLVPSLSFVATANSVVYAGATPVFVDISSLAEPVISLSNAEMKCTSRTKAVVLMHFAGYLCDRQAWRDFAKRKGLFLIEDAAHAVAIDGVGQYGDAAAFSFYGNKNMTTGEGGAVVAPDPALLERVRQMRGHGMTSGTFQRLHSRSPCYDVTMLGFNYRMDELRAAVGLVQLGQVKAWNEKRKALTEVYRGVIDALCPLVTVPFTSRWASSYHILPIVLPATIDRQRLVEHMRDAGIQTTIHYPPIHMLSFYRRQAPSLRLPFTEDFAYRELTLPLHPRMDECDVDRVVTALEAGLQECWRSSRVAFRHDGAKLSENFRA
ncbi:MAG: DegT/DnrJ/EryC1/StrS family aminotransferase [Hyphomicrobium sp.]